MRVPTSKIEDDCKESGHRFRLGLRLRSPYKKPVVSRALTGQLCMPRHSQSASWDGSEDEGMRPSTSKFAAMRNEGRSDTAEYRAKRALCRILEGKGWSASDIVRNAGITPGTVYRALKNIREINRVDERIIEQGRDDVAQDENCVDKNLLAALIAKYGANRDSGITSPTYMAADTDDGTKSSSEQADKSKTMLRKLTASERALCRILRQEHHWTFIQLAAALGAPRPGGRSPVCQAVKQPGSDDVSKDHEIVDKIQLAKLVTHQVSKSPAGKEKQYVHSTPNQSDRNTSRFKPYNTPTRKKSSHRTVSSIPIASPNIFSPSPPQMHATTNHADDCRPESYNAHCLAQFLANVRPGINLSSHYDLFIHRGIDTISKIRALKTWEDADLREALLEWFKTGEGLEGFVPLSDYELLALRQAIRKL
ncbi:hypothetical protein MIND_01258500 [Mycena indigotica]|uniref:Uncharacterized protein n=1 Tax=Mycena indigotica TaxID=2126181 RepID=A0A8H6VV17_9AGAR|nr:uncharacterized protein MIND_01258500 [Mycena indigotica]KAF7291153.1 hypothetical protein MIND_01258500 [Mycena indigotica]